MQQVQQKRKQTYEDYGINLATPEYCPICGNNSLVLDQENERWHCENTQSCSWRGRLRMNEKATIMNAAEASPLLERWYTAGTPEGMSWGWPSLDDYIKMVRGEWTFVIGHTSHGKSHFVDAGIVNVCSRGWKVGMFSPENTPYERHVKGIIQKFIGKRFKDMTLDELRLGRTWISERVFFVDPVEPTFEAVLAQARKLVREHRINVFILDPWNEVEHAVPRGMNETQYVAKKLMQFRRFCEALHIHGIIVAHPSKSVMDRMKGGKNDKMPIVRLTDASGSANFANKCDVGISIWRDTMATDIDDQGHSIRHVNHIHVLKNRNEDQGQTGVRKLVWEPKSTAYYGYDESQVSAFAADRVKAQLDRVYGGGVEGSWVNAVKTEEERLKAQLGERPLAWKMDRKKGSYVFVAGKIGGEVSEVKGPYESVWYAKITKLEGSKVRQLAEEEFPIKEDALDWCEKQAMQNG